jgi:putative transposase
MNVLTLANRDVGVAPTRLKKFTKPNPHSKNLRKGRYSQLNQIYLITTVTENRKPVFKNFHAARNLIKKLKMEQALGRSNTLAFVVMPDHLHWLLQLTSPTELAKILQSVKTLTAKDIGKHFWEPGYHDHALRKEENVKAIARYIVANPLRAGLVKRIGDYPHWDAMWL